MQSLEEYNKTSLNGMKAGFTTGLAMAGLAKACIYYFFGKRLDKIRAFTKEEVYVDLNLENISYENIEVSKGRYEKSILIFTTKDSGDDPDITNGINLGLRLYFVDRDIKNIDFLKDKLQEACLDENLSLDENLKIYIVAGKGIGKVTKAGLDRKIGEAAINTVPRQMIRANIVEALKDLEIDISSLNKDIFVELIAINGEEIAKKTFNEKLGILGGISILGSTGLLKPMSKAALIETIKIDLRTKAEKTKYIVAAPGNYGIDFISKNNIDKKKVVEFSNYIGEFLDLSVAFDIKALLIVGHIGKLIKVAAGIMNTHSNEADARNEIILAHFIKSTTNIEPKLVIEYANKILSSNTTDESISYINELGVLDLVMQSIGKSIYSHIIARLKRAHNLKYKDKDFDIDVAVISFNKNEGELFRIGDVEKVLEGI